MSVEEHAQALIDTMRAAGVARIIAGFRKDADTTEIDRLEIYETNDNGVGGVSFDPLELKKKDDGQIRQAVAALANFRYDGKVASGTLLVDEEDRVWGEGVHEEDIEPAGPRGLRVEL